MEETHQCCVQRPSCLLLFAALGLLLAPAAAASASNGSSRVAEARQHPQEFVQEAVHNEVKAEQNDATHWRFRKEDVKPDGSKTWDIIETKKGEVRHLIAINGQPLNAEQKRTEQDRMQQFLRNRAEQEQKKKDNSGDYDKEQKLMLMLPHALLFHYAGQNGDLVMLDFGPNPNFHATSHESEVFHHMKGKLVIDVKNMRVAQFAGRIASRVDFGWGILGHLNKGGTFDVKQQDVADSHWDMTLLDTQITGKALFFKTISVREKIIESDYHRVSDNLTLEQAANMLKTSASQTANRGKPSPRGQSSGSANGSRHN